jgi:hypothetical protein
MIESPPWLPFQFELLIAGEQIPRLCEFRHSRPTGIGVVFVAAKAATVPETFGPKSKEEVAAWRGPTKRRRLNA